MIRRYLYNQVKTDLRKKMVFIAGPRQVGKTTFSKDVISDEGRYLNWDIPEDREIILNNEIPLEEKIVFDEIHKYKGWRGYLKGIFDKYGNKKKILVVGSAKLDFYRYGGDSLQGRYFFFRLHPFSVAELKIRDKDKFEKLLKLGGFPEPFLSDSETEAKRWAREYRSRLIYEEIESLENISDISKMELLVLRLPDLIGSPLSVNSLREDLQVSHKTVLRYLEILERLYLIFSIPPFGSSLIRAVKKEKKYYFYNWSVLSENLPTAFENMVASHLLKWIHFEQDTKGRDLELRYFRDVEGREVDFVITERLKPVRFVEVKWRDKKTSKNLKYLKKKFPEVQAIQVIGEKNFSAETKEGILKKSAIEFLSELV